MASILYWIEKELKGASENLKVEVVTEEKIIFSGSLKALKEDNATNRLDATKMLVKNDKIVFFSSLALNNYEPPTSGSFSIPKNETIERWW